jgi:hypothetical protein
VIPFHHQLATAVLMATIAACATEPVISTSTPALGNECTGWECTGNAASLGDHLFFWEVDGSRLEYNTAGVRYVKFEHRDGFSMDLILEGHTLKGRAGRIYEGDDLLGAWIRLTDAGGHDYLLRIELVDHIPFLGRFPGPTIPVYYFRVDDEEDGDFKQDLCPSNNLEPEYHGNASAILFAGDRYSPDTMKVIATATEPAGNPAEDVGQWFNIACAGTAMAKMHRYRYTHAAQQVGGMNGRTTTRDQRTAFLKMLTADYCGTGTPFTVDGQAVEFRDRMGLVTPAAPAHLAAPIEASADSSSVESVWTSGGALCLSRPRRERDDPGIRARILRHCADHGHVIARTCRPYESSWMNYGDALSLPTVN